MRSKRGADGLTDRERLFCDAYLSDPSRSQAEAAVKAGYAAHTARVTAAQLLARPYIRAYIDAQLALLHDAAIADADEVMRYLTRVIRGQESEETVVVEGTGDGCSAAKAISKRVSPRDQVKAAELLAKRYGLLTDRVDLSATADIKVDIVDDDDHKDV